MFTPEVRITDISDDEQRDTDKPDERLIDVCCKRMMTTIEVATRHMKSEVQKEFKRLKEDFMADTKTYIDYAVTKKLMESCQQTAKEEILKMANSYAHSALSQADGSL